MTSPRRHSVNSPRFSWQLKVELLDVRPTVWRRLVVPGRITLPKLQFHLPAANLRLAKIKV